MSPRRWERDRRTAEDTGVAALEHELHGKPNRQQQRAAERTAARAEADGFARVTGKHYRSRPTGGAA